MRRTRSSNERCHVCGSPGPQSRYLLDVATAAAIARVSRSTFERWAWKGKVESASTPGGHLRIYLDSLFKDPPFREFDLRKRRRRKRVS
ncbi:MAG: hypothetical protein EHM23_33485 [Acidobacteria bacterium]|nr:MAG: hypothetical protein EHM23_33485 [Acidobacteriota bacterium]